MVLYYQMKYKEKIIVEVRTLSPEIKYGSKLDHMLSEVTSEVSSQFLDDIDLINTSTPISMKNKVNSASLSSSMHSSSPLPLPVVTGGASSNKVQQAQPLQIVPSSSTTTTIASSPLRFKTAMAQAAATENSRNRDYGESSQLPPPPVPKGN